MHTATKTGTDTETQSKQYTVAHAVYRSFVNLVGHMQGHMIIEMSSETSLSFEGSITSAGGLG